ncbi:MAG: hypothetical protein JJW01_01845 [Alphaproteobacteria bacterium]|nr:hypothetical protein [Rickettsiales bacterium]
MIKKNNHDHKALAFVFFIASLLTLSAFFVTSMRFKYHNKRNKYAYHSKAETIKSLGELHPYNQCMFIVTKNITNNYNGCGKYKNCKNKQHEYKKPTNNNESNVTFADKICEKLLKA